ncbi:MAG: hypothetical protein LBC27_03230 [Spirochaetaceae bacterium]|jgi:hypothetical protein|nr:hypothetical protein [Spirochaetaceae bacterium]
MTLINTRKNKLRRIAFSAATAFVTLYLAVYFLSAPRLGPYYDFLMEMRPANQVDSEILLIETGGGDDRGGGNVIAAATVFVLIMTLTEMRASSLLIETPVLGVSSGRSLSEPELVYRFDEEFNIVESNIKNLFDGIRLGSIAPLDAASYVNDVIKLTEQGKNRLLSAAARGDEEQAARFENAASVFGSVYIPSDLLVDLIQPEDEPPPQLNHFYAPMYSRPPPDADGKIRRIPPILNTANGLEYEYAAYSALKKHFSKSELKPTDDGFVLEFEGKNTAGALTERQFVLDKTGSLLFGLPGGEGGAFRKIELSLFLDYAEMDKILYNLLAESPTLAEYANISVENYPPFLYDQAQIVRETLLENPGKELHERWIRLRGAYYDALDNFFDETNGAQSRIISSFSDLGEQENLDPAGRERLDRLRDEQLKMFYTARDVYEDISLLRGQLENELNESFCILGPVSRGTELSAIFANSIMTENYTVPAGIRLILFSSIIVVLFLLVAMNSMNVVFSFCFCVLMTPLTVAGFSYSFIVSGLWIDPVIPGAAAAAGTLVSSLSALFIKNESEIKLRCACAAIVPDAYLKKIIRSGGRVLEKELSVKAAIVTVSRPDIKILENGPDAQKSAAVLKKFYAEICPALTKAGAVIISCDREIVSAAFGSPLECFAAAKTQKISPHSVKSLKSESNPVETAAAAVKVLFKKNSSGAELYAGIDYGECVFGYTALTGYSAAGSAVFRSRVLSNTARRAGAAALISKAASEKIDASLFRAGQPFNALNGDAPAGTENELYYQLIL